MGKPDMSKKINIFHIIEFILAVIGALCMADNVCIHCGKHVIEMQMITSTTFGFLIFTSVVFLGMFFDEYVGYITDLCYDALGGVLCIIAGILVLLFAFNNSDSIENYNYFRLLLGGICIAINGSLFLLEFFLLLFKKDLLGGGN